MCTNRKKPTFYTFPFISNFLQVMPQLLHFLRVDQHTSFNAAGGALASAAAAEAEAAAKGEGDVQPSASTVDATSTEKPFLNSSDKVLIPSLENLCYVHYPHSFLPFPL